MIPGETILSGASSTCRDCGVFVLPMRVLLSGAGFYVGTTCNCGPYSRESGYYATREEAQRALTAGTWEARS